jgi:hypothetical protein
VHFSSLEKISFEGDFNKYFSVYAQANSQIEDLEIMTPDFMQFLIDNYEQYKYFGIECSANNLYIYAPGPFNAKRIKDFSALYTLVDILIPKLNEVQMVASVSS